jgi:hypothetical protein
MIANKLNYLYQICGISYRQDLTDAEIIKSFFVDKQTMLSLSNQRRLEKIMNQLLDQDLSTDDYEFLKEIMLKFNDCKHQLFAKLKSVSKNKSYSKNQEKSRIINVKIKNNKIPKVNFQDQKLIIIKK